MSIFGKAKGILGINARNLLYISRYNSSSDKRFADNKLYTKHFLSSRNIGVAKVFSAIRTYEELKHFKPASLPQTFVIKPNHGFGGEGIIVITGKKDNTYASVGGERWVWDELFRHMVAILDGKYAISGLRDEVIIEERLIPHDYFRKFAEFGLPDVRVIVFNLVPVLAMLRLPTHESKGKANLHLGAIGLGIDLGTGKTTYGVKNNRFITRLPNGERVNSLQIPEWEDVLLNAARCQKHSSIGHLAADLAITNRGVKVVELNARAGLSAQVANRVFLRSRLEKVADLKVISPEQGIEIAKTLFSRKISSRRSTSLAKPVIGLYEPVRLPTARKEHVIAKIDPHAMITELDESVGVDPKEKLLDLEIRNQKIKVPFRVSPKPIDQYHVVIAGKDLPGFLIDLTGTEAAVTRTPGASRDTKILQNVDRKLAEISTQIHFLAILKPLNLEQAKNLFLKHPTASPVFTYKTLDIDIPALRKELGKLRRDFDHQLADLMRAKMDELAIRLSLIETRGTEKMMEFSRKLYGDVSEEEYAEAHAYILHHRTNPDTSQRLTISQVVKRLEESLKRHHLTGWKVILQQEATADMQVNKRGAIFVRKAAQFTENRIQSLIAHEIETHIFRKENGSLQLYRIFEQGTAGYLETEEGLALLHQRQLGMPLGEKDVWSALNVVSIWYAKEMGFVELFHYLLQTYAIDRETAWRVCVKVKRGLIDTAVHASFTKDRVYYTGFKKVSAFFADQGYDGLHNLYMGKIGLADLPMLTPMSQWKISYIPSFASKVSDIDLKLPEDDSTPKKGGGM
ncbi:MAG: hypothetical protein A2898_04660 [Candidatus Kerfeldbacteria bacterium RIFCSPLOWO2_01_FULL_48_11]|uniref:ATP-grasp domain-containing protein n=1 Tax=Candidatus Kerfeldbacteria bacterium RIFCSPLOWO2_01_FULL_48_11 TaxID=1798543 RepID=A0A1G2B3R5_9BACT|nr:MAG: hypothetical protein A2898_04660 [Candidatus Kerfeldbacteria bacterium RIFCSPLOWO2_01_FULL_48_11]